MFVSAIAARSRLQLGEERGSELAGKLLHQLVGRLLAGLECLCSKVVAMLGKLLGVFPHVRNGVSRLADVACNLLLLRLFPRIAISDDVPDEKPGYEADCGYGYADHGKHLAGDSAFLWLWRWCRTG